MSARLRKLLERLNAATQGRGKKKELARALGVPPSRISEWLHGKFEPAAETTLHLLDWVTAEEAKTKSPGGAETPPGQVTRHHTSGYEKLRQIKKRRYQKG